jgi:hypothetical protein
MSVHRPTLSLTQRALLLAVGCALLLASAGCRERCRDLNRQYQAATAQQPTFDNEAYDAAMGRASDEGLRADSTVHMAVALSTATLNTLVGRALETTIAAKLKAVESIDVAGVQPVDIEADPGIASVELTGSDVCDHCFQIDAGLRGDVGVDVPVLGTRQTRLDGSLTFVAPIDLRPPKQGETKSRVTLGLSKLADQSRPVVVDQLEGLSGRWSDVLSGALQSVLAEKLTETIPDVTLANFGTPSLGIDGLKWSPTGLRVDAAAKRIVVGFRSNLPSEAGRTLTDLEDLLTVDGDRGVSLALAPDLILAAVRAGFRTGTIPDRYTPDGDPSEGGPVRFSLDGIDVVEPSDGQGLALGLGFRAWHLPSFGHCMWFGGRGVIGVAAEGGRVRATVERVSMETGSAASVLLQQADWKASEWMQRSSALADASLSSDSLSLPGLKWNASGLQLRAGAAGIGLGFGIRQADSE